MKNRLSWQRVPSQAISFKELDNEIAILIGYAIAYTAFGFLIGFVILNHPSPILNAVEFLQDVWYTIVFKILLLLVVPAIIYFGLWGYRLRDLLLGLRPTWKNISAALLLTAMGFFINGNRLQPLGETIGTLPDAPLRLFVGVLMPLLMAAIPEEFFFRGYLQTRLEKKWNRLLAILVSTTLFTAWHLPSRYLLASGVEGQAGDWGSVLLGTGVPVFIVGLFFAIHWSRYRNMVILVLTHWAIDTLPSLTSYFMIRL